MALIGIDCRFGSVYGGLGTYTRELVSALTTRADPWSYALFTDDPEAVWLRPLHAISNVKIINAPFPHYSLVEQMQFPNLIQDEMPTLMLFPHFNVPLSCPAPFVCTVHDLILHRFPNEASFLKRLAYRLVLRQALSRAEAISTVSSFTFEDLREHYGNRIAKKTEVASPGVHESFRPASPDAIAAFRLRHGLEKPFLLYVGNCKTHKNVSLLLQAFSHAQLSGMELVLLTGGKELSSLPRTRGVRILSGIPFSDLPVLYSAAHACVTATLLEGFCLPLLESMACRVPVMATWCGPLPEVCSGHALLVEPVLTHLADGLRRIVTDHTLRRSSTLDAAQAHARNFTWSRSAEKTSVLLQRVISRLEER